MKKPVDVVLGPFSRLAPLPAPIPDDRAAGEPGTECSQRWNRFLSEGKPPLVCMMLHVGKMANTSPGALMNASMLSAVQLRGNVPHSTIEVDIQSKTSFWLLALARNIRERTAKPQTVNNKYVELGCRWTSRARGYDVRRCR